MTKTATVHAQQRWEYMSIARKTDSYLARELNTLGQEAWELVTINYAQGQTGDMFWTAFLKRPAAGHVAAGPASTGTGQEAAPAHHAQAPAAPSPAVPNPTAPSPTVPSPAMSVPTSATPAPAPEGTYQDGDLFAIHEEPVVELIEEPEEKPDEQQ